MTAVLSKNAAAATRIAEQATDAADLRRLLGMLGLVDDRGQLLPDDDEPHNVPVLMHSASSDRLTIPMTVRPAVSTAPQALRELPPVVVPPKATKRKPPRPINHGTTGGYRAHSRYGIPMCDPCREAQAAVKRHGRPAKTEHQYVHGTAFGYRREMKEHGAACDACRDAKRTADREWTAARRARQKVAQ